MKQFLLSYSLSHPLFSKIALGALWVILCGGIVLLLHKEISPDIAIDSLTVSYPELTEAVLPGGMIEQDIYWDRSTLESIDIAFSYPEDVWPDTQVMISVLKDGSVIADQVLSLTSLPNGSYLNFSVHQTHCSGSTFTVRIENLSEEPSSAFSMLYTEDARRYLNNVSNYRLDGTVQNGRLLCQMYYVRSYSYYKACVMAVWILLFGIAVTGIVLRLPNRQ